MVKRYMWVVNQLRGRIMCVSSYNIQIAILRRLWRIFTMHYVKVNKNVFNAGIQLCPGVPKVVTVPKRISNNSIAIHQ